MLMLGNLFWWLFGGEKKKAASWFQVRHKLTGKEYAVKVRNLTGMVEIQLPPDKV